MDNKALFYDIFKVNKYYFGLLWTTSGLVVSALEKSRNLAACRIIKSLPGLNSKFIHRVSKYRTQLINYFNGIPLSSRCFKIDYSFCTQWQKNVYKHVINIPYGHIVSYKDIANLLNKPNSSRAVGSALKNNRLIVIIPCHRVIHNNCNIGGFSKGLTLKKYLLQIEKINI